MEYVSILEIPSMVARLQDLITDPKPIVVKKAIRDFTNVYRHSLSLLSSGELDPVKFKKSYYEVSVISDQLISLLKIAENEGIMVHLVRYLEATLVSHINSDLSNYPLITKMMAPMLKKCVNALLDVVNAPYVGGCALCVAIRALFTVACYQEHFRPVVTDVTEALIKSPPPNLFDHNVRSFHKTLQRNLFRLLKLSKDNLDKERLIDLMVKVGVPRKRLWEWAPRVSRKRSSLSSLEDRIIYECLSLPSLKKRKISEIDIIRYPSPSGSTSLLPKLSASIQMKNVMPILDEKLPSLKTKMTSKVDAATAILDQRLLGTKNTSITKSIKMLERNSSQFGRIKLRSSVASSNLCTESGQSLLSVISNVMASGTQECCPILDGKENSPVRKHDAHFPYLSTTLLPSSKSSPPTCAKSNVNSSIEMINLPANSSVKLFKKIYSDTEVHFTNRCSFDEKNLYNKLTTENVVDLILNSVKNLPKDKPKYIPSTKLEDVDTMREKVAIMFSLYVKVSAGEKVSLNRSSSTAKRGRSNPKVSNYLDEKSLYSLGTDTKNGLFDSNDVYLHRYHPSSSIEENSPTCVTTTKPTSRDPRSQTPPPTSSTPFGLDPRLSAQPSMLFVNRDSRLQKMSTGDHHDGLCRSPTMHPPMFFSPPSSLGCSTLPAADPRLSISANTFTEATNKFSYSMTNSLDTRVKASPVSHPRDGNPRSFRRRSKLFKYNNRNFSYSSRRWFTPAHHYSNTNIITNQY